MSTEAEYSAEIEKVYDDLRGRKHAVITIRRGPDLLVSLECGNLYNTDAHAQIVQALSIYFPDPHEIFRRLLHKAFGRPEESSAPAPASDSLPTTSPPSRGNCHCGFPVGIAQLAGREGRLQPGKFLLCARCDCHFTMGGEIVRRSSFCSTGAPA